jgi:hypothetical protein
VTLMPSRKGRGRHRQHTYHRPPDASGNRKLWGSHRCPECGKWCYASRDAAESSVQQLHPGATVHYYRCLGWWHFTSMTAEQVEGLKDRRHAAGDYEDEDDEEPEEVA